MSIIPICNVGVYHDSDTTLWHFGKIQDYTGYSYRAPDYFLHPANLDSFVQSSYDLKFAAFHVAFPCSNEWVERFHTTYKIVNHSIVVCSELHQNTVDQLLNLDLPNVSIFVSGFINQPFENAKIYQWMDWFITAADFYRYDQPTLLEKKLVDSNKNKFFDILLGCQRPHRDYVYQYINENLADKTVMTYFRRWNVDLRTTDHIFEKEGIEFLPDSNYHHTVHRIRYYGRLMNLSAVVPIDIYNKTHYSLVTETNSLNHFNFYTEKIVKPILAGRLFVVIAGARYLHNLRLLGFKTFSSVVDESYDYEEDHVTRWRMALEQVKKLCDQSPDEIKHKIKDVVDHNRRLLLEDWNGKFILKLQSVIDPFLTSAHKAAD